MYRYKGDPFNNIYLGFEEIFENWDNLYEPFKFKPQEKEYRKSKNTFDIGGSHREYYDPDIGLELSFFIPGYNKDSIKVKLVKVPSRLNSDRLIIILSKKNTEDITVGHTIPYSSSLKLNEGKIVVNKGMLEVFFPIKEKVVKNKEIFLEVE